MARERGFLIGTKSKESPTGRVTLAKGLQVSGIRILTGGTMNFYEKIIVESTGATHDEAVAIEDIMRNDIFHSTLDWQTKAQLKKAAKEAQEIYKLCGKI
jgi:hypothetical protein